MKEYILTEEDLSGMQLSLIDSFKELVMCRDCKYWSPIVNGKVGYCNIGYETVTERYDGYCSHAERKSE